MGSELPIDLAPVSSGVYPQSHTPEISSSSLFKQGHYLNSYISLLTVPAVVVGNVCRWNTSIRSVKLPRVMASNFILMELEFSTPLW
jgi:hypothetical protein